MQKAEYVVESTLSEGDLLCRTCYETESTRFHTHLAVEDANSRESEGKHPWRSGSTFYSLDTAEVDAIAVDSPVFSPLSAESGSMAENVEMKYKLEQSKELLNQVFEILGIAKISDL